MTKLPETVVEALKVIATTEFKPFDKHDWEAFAGCQTDEPMIGEIGDLIIVLDGEYAEFYLGDEIAQFELSSI